MGMTHECCARRVLLHLFPGKLSLVAWIADRPEHRPWGGAEIGEVNRVGLRLRTVVGDDHAWFREWAREARTVEDRGRERLADGRTVSGAQYLQRASIYYHVGERFLQPKEPGRARRLYARRPLPARRRAPHQASAPGARGNSLRGREHSRDLRARRAGQPQRQDARNGVLRRARCDQGDSILQRRRRPGGARHRLPDRGRAGKRREHPVPESISASRDRTLRDAGMGVARRASRDRSPSASASWRSASAATTRRAPPPSSRAMPAASPGAHSGTIRRSGGSASSVSRAPTCRRCRSLPLTSSGW